MMEQWNTAQNEKVEYVTVTVKIATQKNLANFLKTLQTAQGF
jgi:hypothetical protein